VNVGNGEYYVKAELLTGKKPEEEEEEHHCRKPQWSTSWKYLLYNSTRSRMN
jgi:hypothetical protein